MFKKVLLAASIVSAAFSVTANADDTGVYLFGSVGQSDFDTSKSDVNDTYFSPSDAGNYTSSLDNTDTAYKVGAGFQLSKNFALEVQYIDLGQAEYKANILNGSANLKSTAKVSGGGMNIVGTLPLDKFSLFGKLGYQSLKTEIDEKISVAGVGSASDNNSNTDWSTSYGVGGTYALNESVSLVAEYERYTDVSDSGDDVDMLSAGLRYNF